MRIRCLTLALLLALASLFALPANGEETTRVACVGDSITYGAGVEQREKNNYPRVLGELLGDDFEVRNFGVSGATLLKQGDKPYWKQAAFDAATKFQPHLVIIKLGTNDTKPQNWKHKQHFADDLHAMIDHFAKLKSQPVVLLGRCAPVARDRWGINEATIQGEALPIIDAVAKQRGLAAIDYYGALKKHPELLPDGVHPNAAGARIMAEKAAAAVRMAVSPAVTP